MPKAKKAEGVKVAINRCFGGFNLSEKAVQWLRDNGHPDADEYYCDGLEQRTDPALIACIEAVGAKKASGLFAELHIVVVPKGVKWHISRYDGLERIDEDHQSWW